MAREIREPLDRILNKKRGVEYHTTLALYPADVRLADKRAFYWASARLTINENVYEPLLQKDGSLVSGLNQSSDRYEATILPTEELRRYLRENAERLLNAQAELGIWLKDLASGLVEHRVIFTGLFSSITVRKERASLPILSTSYANTIGVESLESLCGFKGFRNDPRCGYTGTEMTCNYRYNDPDGCDGRWGTAKASKFGGIGPGTIDAKTLAPTQNYQIAPYQILMDGGTVLPQRAILTVVGCSVTDDSVNNTTTLDMSGIGGGTPYWDTIQGPLNDKTLDMQNFITAVAWTTVGAGHLWEMYDVSSTTTGSLVNIHTGATSTAKPLTVTAQGTANGIQMNTAGELAVLGSGHIVATKVASSAGAAPTTSATIAYDTTSNTLEYGENGTNRIVANLNGTQTLSNKTLTTPTIASFTNATHNHSNAAGGGTLASSAVPIGTGLTDSGSAVLVDVSSGFTPTWLGTHTFNQATSSGVTPINGVVIGTSSSPTSGNARASASTEWRGQANSGSGSTATAWRAYTNVSASDGTAQWILQYRNSQVASLWADGFTVLQDGGGFKLSGSTSGSTTVKASATAGGSVTLPAVTDTLVGKATTDTLTNKTLTDSSNVLGGVTMTLGSDADGDMYYRASGVLTRLPKGTANQVLAMNGGATAPNWVTSSSNTAWSSLTNPSTDLALSMGGNATAFTFGTRSTGNWWTMNDGNSTTTGSLLRLYTGTTSTAKPITITAQGTSNGVEMDTSGNLQVLGTGNIIATKVTSSAGAAPTTSATIAYDTTSNTLEYGENGTNRIVANLNGTQTLSNKTLTTPTIASFTNATHNHSNAAGGGTLASSAVPIGTGLTDSGSAVLVDVSSGFTPTWLGTHTFNQATSSGVTPINGVVIGTSSSPTSGNARASASTEWRGQANSGSGSTATAWRAYTNVSASDGTAQWILQYRNSQVASLWADGFTVLQDGGGFKLSGSTSGSTTVKASATAGGSVTLPAVTDTLVGKATTDTLTNKTLTDSSNVLGGVTMTLGSDADGDMYYRASGVLTRLPKGTANQVLAMNGGATAPNWVTSSSNTAWSSLTNPSTDLALSMGGNATAFTFGTRSTGNWWTMNDGNSTTTGSLLRLYTGTTSTAKPITITAQGTSNGVEMDTSGNLQVLGTGNIIATKVTSSAGAAPTTSALIAYDTTANTFKGGVNGASKTFLMTDGSGANLTSLNASNISSGTLADARLSSNVFYVDGTRAAVSTATSADGFTFTANSVNTGDHTMWNATGLTSGSLLRAAIPTSGFTGRIIDVRDNAGTPADKFVVDSTGKITTGSADAGLITSGTLTKARQNSATVYNDAGNTWSTGAQDFGSATSLKIPTSAGVAPTTSGHVAFDSTTHSLEYGMNGTNRVVPTVFYTNQAWWTANAQTKYFDTSAAETSLLDETVTIPGGWFAAGRAIEIKLTGLITTDTTPPTIRLKIKLNSTPVIIADSTAITMTNISAQARTFELSATLMCLAAGNPGVFYANGVFAYQTGNKTKDFIEILNTNNGLSGINTANNQQLHVTAQFGTASALNAMEIQTGWILGLAK